MGKALRDRRGQVFLMTKVCTPRPRAPRWRCGSSRSRCAGCTPTIWISGRSTSASTTTTPSGTSPRAAWSRRSSGRKAQGKVRFVGFTGHKDPGIHLRMLAFGYPFDACQLPLNGFDASFRSFQRAGAAGAGAPAALRAIGMKSLGGNGRAMTKRVSGRAGRAALRDEPAGVHHRVGHRLDGGARAEPAHRPPLHADGRGGASGLRRRLEPPAQDGRFELYKTSAEHEGDEGRRQHGFPTQDEVPM